MTVLRRLMRWIARVAIVMVVVMLGYGGYVIVLQETGNFHVVVPGEAYRSNQPTATAIEAYAKDHGIKSIINLKGKHKGSPWYDAETATAARLGIKHYDFGMSASRILPQAEAEQLVALMRKAEKPLLIHCEWGADRSGLASALYFAAIAKKGESAAEGQISLYYGHLPFPISKPYAMDRTFEALEPWLGFPDS